MVQTFRRKAEVLVRDTREFGRREVLDIELFIPNAFAQGWRDECKKIVLFKHIYREQLRVRIERMVL